ncbi:unnamed protein product [Prorocentrum cordatum]|uniref:Transposase Tc1-like domain-containing protein n=1 Tax=Prorocentrum cordatum TaxID=2364126 RepID=A0ABN9WPI6_9DINO|nr:unnamed protein product [Polarella glacialis]
MDFASQRKVVIKRDQGKKYKHSACGRKPWKVTPEVGGFLVKKLLALRGTCICTAPTLQHTFKRDMDTDVAKSTICKVLQKNGYKWLPQAQKPRYSKDDRDARLAFSQEVVKMSARELEKYLALCMDGVVLSVPPEDPIERSNFVHIGETHMRRKPTEGTR